MSRAGYNDDIDGWELIRWRGQVASAIRGRRGQRLLLDMYAALEAMPVKALAAGELETAEGAVCALGAVGKCRGLEMSGVDPHDYEAVSALFGVPHQLAREVMFMNDEAGWRDTPEARYERMKQWVLANIQPVVDEAASHE